MMSQRLGHLPSQLGRAEHITRIGGDPRPAGAAPHRLIVPCILLFGISYG